MNLKVMLLPSGKNKATRSTVADVMNLTPIAFARGVLYLSGIALATVLNALRVWSYFR